MSSSEQHVSSSQPSLDLPARLLRKSQFTYKDLAQLALSAPSTPLRVIAHVDLDAFYAQCEGIRLNQPEDQPLAVRQWDGLIAVNYPSRKYGLSRHIDISEAKRLCPDLIMQHVATWKIGEEKWSYHEDAYDNIATHKVSLDPYRLESRRILQTIKDSLPASPIQRVEKAGIDEVFLDLSAQVYSTLLERYPELQGPAPYDDPSENLPAPPNAPLEWENDSVVGLETLALNHGKLDTDWDDIAISIGSEIVRFVRASIKKHLKYTCSAGISNNKMISKLGSAYNKPNQQTVVIGRATEHFLKDIKLTKIRNLGGKLGARIANVFKTESIQDLLQVELEQLKREFGEESGAWIYETIRGVDLSEVTPRTQIKSMLSAKSFRPAVNSPEVAAKWLRIFVADIFSRLVEEGILENKRRPKTMALHHRQRGHTRSRQLPIPLRKVIDEIMLFELAQSLLGQLAIEGDPWPCDNLSLSVGGFEDGIGDRGIVSFLVKGEDAKTLNEIQGKQIFIPQLSLKDGGNGGPTSNGIKKFFTKKGLTMEKLESQSPPLEHFGEGTKDATKIWSESLSSKLTNTGDMISLEQETTPQYTCNKCNQSFPMEERAEHEDWHFAKSLEEAESHRLPQTQPHLHTDVKDSRKRGGDFSQSKASAAKRPTTSRKTEKGQARLAFGPSI
ncbi:MAG: DNA-directed DNA polymerase eta rad30 [Trizodia sp. TS-e1964]|nr:MAG: DNA-directed DNA polymerase eta rad30 [Trizodia sp. TS-e1964]